MAAGDTSASCIASAAASAKSSALVRSCFPNFVTPTPMMATRRIDPPGHWVDVSTHHDTRAREESSATGRAPGHRDRVRGHEGSVGVTLEEGLVALLAAVAGILLFVGLTQALESPRLPRRRRRTSPPTDAPQDSAGPVKQTVVMELPPRAPYTGPERRRSPRPGSRPRARIVPPPPAAPAVTVESGLPHPPPADLASCAVGSRGSLAPRARRRRGDAGSPRGCRTRGARRGLRRLPGADCRGGRARGAAASRRRGSDVAHLGGASGAAAHGRALARMAHRGR